MPKATHHITNEPLMDALVEAIGNGSPRQTACRALGMDPKWLYEVFFTAREGVRRPNRGGYNKSTAVVPETVQLYIDLVARIEEAEAKWEQTLIERVQTAALAVNEKTGIPEWRAATWLLEHGRTRGNWHPEKSVKVTMAAAQGEVSEEHRTIGELSDSDLLELVDADFRGLIVAPTRTLEPVPVEAEP